MEKVKETTGSLLERIKERANTAGSEPKSSKGSCDVCHKVTKDTIKTSGYFPTYRCKDCNEQLKQEHIEREIKRNIPPKFIDIRTDYDALLKTSLGKSLFITGDVGRGKTVFMANICKESIKQGRQVKWVSYPAFIMTLQNKFSKTNEPESSYDMAEKVARFEGILFIDDIGAEKLTDFVRQITYFIVNEREQRMLQTVMTSNFNLEEINEYIDRRIASRICGMCETLNFTGTTDKRIKKGKA